jgi:hypothetical protein
MGIISSCRSSTASSRGASGWSWEGRLTEVINVREDQVIFVDLGPAEGRAPGAIRALGRRYAPPERIAVVV